MEWPLSNSVSSRHFFLLWFPPDPVTQNWLSLDCDRKLEYLKKMQTCKLPTFESTHCEVTVLVTTLLCPPLLHRQIKITVF